MSMPEQPNSPVSVPQEESYVKRRLREIAEKNQECAKDSRSAAPRPSRCAEMPSAADAPTVDRTTSSTGTTTPTVAQAPTKPAKSLPARPSAVVPPKPTRAERLRQLGRPARPLHSSRTALTNGRFSRIWDAQFRDRPGSFLYLWEGYLLLERGAVLDLEVHPGAVTALIEARGVEQVRIEFDPIEPERWRSLVERCGESCDSWVNLLTGFISYCDVEGFYTDPQGLMPSLPQIRTDCTCNAPHQACLHITATLIALGAWLDEHPLDLCTLREADREFIISRAEYLRGVHLESDVNFLNQELEKFLVLEAASP